MWVARDTLFLTKELKFEISDPALNAAFQLVPDESMMAASMPNLLVFSSTKHSPGV
jgi:hypothetical protein